MANGPATLTLPESYFDLVRPGGAVVRPVHAARRRAGLAAPGHDPACPADPGQAGTGRHAGVLRAPVRHRPPDMALGVLPLGYNEGIPRHATNTADMLFTRGRRVSIAGTVNLNHIILDLGDEPAEAG